jgi:hypothetical protein
VVRYRKPGSVLNNALQSNDPNDIECEYILYRDLADPLQPYKWEECPSVNTVYVDTVKQV